MLCCTTFLIFTNIKLHVSLYEVRLSEVPRRHVQMQVVEDRQTDRQTSLFRAGPNPRFQ